MTMQLTPSNAEEWLNGQYDAKVEKLMQAEPSLQRWQAEAIVLQAMKTAIGRFKTMKWDGKTWVEP